MKVWWQVKKKTVRLSKPVNKKRVLIWSVSGKTVKFLRIQCQVMMTTESSYEEYKTQLRKPQAPIKKT